MCNAGASNGGRSLCVQISRARIYLLPVLDKSHALTVRDGHSFAKRIVNTWNSLLNSVVLSKSVATFRHKVNKMHFSDYCGL